MNLKGKPQAAYKFLVIALLLFPPVAYADNLKQRALRGLGGVEVLVETIDLEAGRLGLTEAQIQTDVELRLRKAGVRVLTEKESQETPGEPYLYVMINAFVDQTPTSVGFSIRVELMEQVTLARGFKARAAIWRTGAAGTVGTGNIRKIRESVGDLVDKFINDYLAANPK